MNSRCQDGDSKRFHFFHVLCLGVSGRMDEIKEIRKKTQRGYVGEKDGRKRHEKSYETERSRKARGQRRLRAGRGEAGRGKEGTQLANPAPLAPDVNKTATYLNAV